MRIILYILLCCIPGILGAQHRSVNCIKKPQWSQILKQAQEEKKMIFVDCGASWCGPCKIFASEVLTKDSVADFFNERFISVYMDIEKDSMPPVTFMPNISSIPSVMFIDAEKKEVVHAKIGGLSLSNIIGIGRTALGENIATRREMLKNGQLPKEKMLTFLTDLANGGYKPEYFTYLPRYMDTLTLRSLENEANWELCKRELYDVTLPFFQEIWTNRDKLFELYGEKEVMEWFIQKAQYQIFHELDWQTKRETFNDTSFQKLYDWIASSNLPEKADYLMQLDIERLARNSEYKNLFKRLQTIWEKPWNEEKRRDFIIPFIQKIYLNAPEEDQKACIRFTDKLAKQSQDKGVKAYFLRLESEIWKHLGNEKKARQLDSLAVICINPNYYNRSK